MTLSLYILYEDSKRTTFRMNRITGETWYFDAGKWVKVAEPTQAA